MYKSIYITFPTEELKAEIQKFIEQENKTNGYLIGLSENMPVQSIEDLIKNPRYIHDIMANLINGPFLMYTMADEISISSIYPLMSDYIYRVKMYLIFREYFYTRLKIGRLLIDTGSMF